MLRNLWTIPYIALIYTLKIFSEASYLTMPPLKFNNFDKIPLSISIKNSGFNGKYKSF